MDRRAFGRLMAAGLGAVALPREIFVSGSLSPATSYPEPPLRVDRERLRSQLAELSRFGSTGDGGVSRPAYGDADLEARAFVRRLMEEAGLKTFVDAAGNLLGRRGGRDSDRRPVMIGSHIDSVPHGGRFDGPLGVVAAIEAARTLFEAGRRTHHPMEVVVFSNEEDGKVGSRAMAGEVTPGELDRVTNSGYTIREGLERVGGDPEALDAVRRQPDDAAAFLELHVEQGDVLEQRDIDVGVVQGIVGIKRWQVTVDGQANHAGTTPMDARSDALVAAARFVDVVHRRVRERPGRQVATVGRIRAHPGAANVVPGRVEHTLEIRDLEMETIDQVFEQLREEAESIGRTTGTDISFERYYVSRAAPTDPRLRDVVEDSARSLNLSTLRMPSGAGHDAQSVARFAPVGMVFVPSVDGVSHSPEEFTRPEDVGNGADVLLNAFAAADGRDWTEDRA